MKERTTISCKEATDNTCSQCPCRWVSRDRCTMREAARLGSFAANATLLGRGRVVPVGRLVRLVVRALAPQVKSITLDVLTCTVYLYNQCFHIQLLLLGVEQTHADWLTILSVHNYNTPECCKVTIHVTRGSLMWKTQWMIPKRQGSDYLSNEVWISNCFLRNRVLVANLRNLT